MLKRVIHIINYTALNGKREYVSRTSGITELGKDYRKKWRSQELNALWDASKSNFDTDWQPRRNKVSLLHMSPSFECDYRADCATSEITWFYNCTTKSKRLPVSHNRELPSQLDYMLTFRVRNELLQNKHSRDVWSTVNPLGPATTSALQVNLYQNPEDGGGVGLWHSESD